MENTQKKLAKVAKVVIVISLLLIAFIKFVIVPGDEPEQAPPAQLAEEVEDKAPVAVRNAPFILPSLSLFEERFNSAMVDLDNDMRIHDLRLKDTSGAFAVTQYMLTDNIGITFTLNKPLCTVKEITFITTSDGTTTNTLFIMSAMAGLISVVAPDLPKESRGQIMTKLMSKENDFNHSTIKNGIKYWSQFNPEMGYWFGASLPE